MTSSSSSPSNKNTSTKSNNKQKKKQRVEIQKKASFGNSLIASKEYKPGDIILREAPFAFGEGEEDPECYFSFIQRAIGKTIQTIKKTDLRGNTFRDEKMRQMKRTFADLTVMRELDYDRAILRDELIANKFYTSMRGHSILDGGFEVDDIVGIVNRCTLNSFRVKTLTRKDVVMLTPQVYRNMDAADLVDAYIEIGEEKTLAVGVFIMASAVNHSCLPNAFASFSGDEEEERRLESEQQRQREEENEDEFSARRHAGPSTSRSVTRSETAEIFTTSEEQNKITIRAYKPIRKGEEITVSYGPIFHSGNIDERRTELKRTHQFICRCPTCLSEAAQLGADMESKMIAAKQKEKVVGDLIQNYVESGKYETREVLEALSNFKLDIRRMQVFGKACFDIAAQLVQAEQFEYACEYQTLALHSLILRCEGIDEDDISIAWEILRLLFVKRLVKYRGGDQGTQQDKQALNAALVMKDSDLITRGKRILKKYYGKKYPYELFLQQCARDPFEIEEVATK